METTNTAPSPGATADGGHDVTSEGENVLVLAGSISGDADDYCIERISAHRPVTPNVLFVSLDESPDSRVDAVVRHGGAQPGDLGVVCCENVRSAAATSGTSHGPGAGSGPAVGHGPWITSVSSPGDLTGLGMRIGQALSAWEDDPAPVEVCFHSLTTLLQYVDEREAFRFCHAVTRHVTDSDGAQSHFHLDPGAVDERTVHVLASLFDRVEDRT